MWGDWKLIPCIKRMAMLVFQSLSIKWPKRIPFPYRSIRDKFLSRLSWHSCNSVPPPNHGHYSNHVTEGVRRKSKPDIHCIVITKTLWSEDIRQAMTLNMLLIWSVEHIQIGSSDIKFLMISLIRLRNPIPMANRTWTIKSLLILML